ncbi:hypothetical protein HUN33_14755 [Acinetobacter bereziniae]|uniref:hypothetical protein n=1 Tax=Acinetobacter bereziniae TaxID=106648 RepID=UPI0015812813|nr:hypothetical protein [Acinetobacter bereziniae]NUG81295.1 hypothetical protein [Acinetobacter bereziniae]
MSNNYDVIVKCYYYNKRSLIIEDVNWLMEVLSHRFGNSINITFLEMNDSQKEESTHFEGSKFKILAIDKNIHIYIYNKEKNDFIRDEDLEHEIKNGKRRDLI